MMCDSVVVGRATIGCQLIPGAPVLAYSDRHGCVVHPRDASILMDGRKPVALSDAPLSDRQLASPRRVFEHYRSCVRKALKLFAPLVITPIGRHEDTCMLASVDAIVGFAVRHHRSSYSSPLQLAIVGGDPRHAETVCACAYACAQLRLEEAAADSVGGSRSRVRVLTSAMMRLRSACAEDGEESRFWDKVQRADLALRGRPRWSGREQVGSSSAAAVRGRRGAKKRAKQEQQQS
jgi:hypothetical protein